MAANGDGNGTTKDWLLRGLAALCAVMLAVIAFFATNTYARFVSLDEKLGAFIQSAEVRLTVQSMRLDRLEDAERRRGPQ